MCFRTSVNSSICCWIFWKTFFSTNTRCLKRWNVMMTTIASILRLVYLVQTPAYLEAVTPCIFLAVNKWAIRCWTCFMEVQSMSTQIAVRIGIAPVYHVAIEPFHYAILSLFYLYMFKSNCSPTVLGKGLRIVLTGCSAPENFRASTNLPLRSALFTVVFINSC